MMPRPNQSMESYLHGCAVAAGEFLPRATEEDIACLKSQHYVVNSDTLDGITIYAWAQHLPGVDPSKWEFQDDEPSYTEADAWALALQHARTPTGPY